MTTESKLYILLAIITMVTIWVPRLIRYRKVSLQARIHAEQFIQILDERDKLIDDFFDKGMSRQVFMKKLRELDNSLDGMSIKQSELQHSLEISKAILGIIGKRDNPLIDRNPIAQLCFFDVNLSKRLHQTYDPTDIDTILTTMMLNFYMTKDSSQEIETQMTLIKNGIDAYTSRGYSLGNVGVVAGSNAAAFKNSVSPLFKPFDSKALLEDLEKAKLHQKLVDKLPPKPKAKVAKI